jgi:hypothetical protein
MGRNLNVLNIQWLSNLAFVYIETGGGLEDM